MKIYLLKLRDKMELVPKQKCWLKECRCDLVYKCNICFSYSCLLHHDDIHKSIINPYLNFDENKKCYFSNCSNKVLKRWGICSLCKKHFCSYHFENHEHERISRKITTDTNVKRCNFCNCDNEAINNEAINSNRCIYHNNRSLFPGP